MPIEDVNLQPNFCGHDINMAQRIMDCGEADHILCSEDACSKYFQDMREGSEVKVTPLQSAFKIKHGRNVRLYSITKRVGEHQYGNATPPTVKWTYPILPYVARHNAFDLFHYCSSLTVVGVTNDQIARTLPELLKSKKRGPLGNLKHLDVYYASDKILEHMPVRETAIVEPGAVQGDPDRSIRKLKKEKTDSICAFQTLAKEVRREIGVSLYTYRLSPIAGILAGDADGDRGVMRVTHYIWGRTSGSCPTMVVRPGLLREVYDVYAAYLGVLRENSQPLRRKNSPFQRRYAR